jgi:hypothetical protein
MKKEKKQKTARPYRVVNVYPELTQEEYDIAKKEVAKKVYNVFVNKIF